jgi:hypothetical protein
MSESKPLIYTSAVSKEPLVLDQTKIKFSPNPNPQLIKYGFNNLLHTLDTVSVISNPYWIYGLSTNFSEDFETTQQIKKTFGIKHFDRITAIMWELLNLFGLVNQTTTLATSANSDIGSNQTTSLTHMFKKQFDLNLKFSSSNSDIFFVLVSANTDLEENAALLMVIKELASTKHKRGSNIILQLFSTQTSASAELITYLSSLFDATYLVKPVSSNDLIDSKYIVFINAKTDFQFPSVKIPGKTFIQSFGIKSIPMDITNMIQCSNSLLIPAKYHTYNKIQAYLKTEVYEGATYVELKNAQIANVEQWIKTFSDKDLIQKAFDDGVKLTDKRCTRYANLLIN